MQKEEKQLDVGIEAIIQRVQDIKASITQFLIKLEQEYMTLSWPTVLDNFALLSGQINGLNRLLRSDKMPQLRNYVLIPLALSQDRDLELEKLTECRLPVFNHEVAPIYLRTKPEPEVEEKMAQIHNKSSAYSHDALQKQINTLNKLSATVQDSIKSARDSWESDMVQKSSIPQMSSQSDTTALIGAVVFGKNLKPSQRPNTPSSGQSGMQDQRLSMQSGQQGMQINKAPSGIKTNIKAATNIHPYAR